MLLPLSSTTTQERLKGVRPVTYMRKGDLLQPVGPYYMKKSWTKWWSQSDFRNREGDRDTDENGMSMASQEHHLRLTQAAINHLEERTTRNQAVATTMMNKTLLMQNRLMHKLAVAEAAWHRSECWNSSHTVPNVRLVEICHCRGIFDYFATGDTKMIICNYHDLS